MGVDLIGRCRVEGCSERYHILGVCIIRIYTIVHCDRIMSIGCSQSEISRIIEDSAV